MKNCTVFKLLFSFAMFLFNSNQVGVTLLLQKNPIEFYV